MNITLRQIILSQFGNHDHQQHPYDSGCMVTKGVPFVKGEGLDKLQHPLMWVTELQYFLIGGH